jgi:hypothetical protein
MYALLIKSWCDTTINEEKGESGIIIDTLSL